MKSIEETLLQPSSGVVTAAAAELFPRLEPHIGRLAILEAVSAHIGGWDVEDYWARFANDQSAQPESDPIPWATKIYSDLCDTPIPPPLALAALSREDLSPNARRSTGAFHTDWRLAQLLSGQAVKEVRASGVWVDPACGSGMLLTAAAMQCTPGSERNSVISERLVGADLSPHALRGTRLAVASLTCDLSIVEAFSDRLLYQDSLQSPDEWAHVAPSGTALVIANPPWEKLKVTKHELAKRDGIERHYGQQHAQDYDTTEERKRLLAYVAAVAKGTSLQGKGEHDLYKLFLELALGLASTDGGVLAMLLPAGLIRSLSTESLRREILATANTIQLSVMENRQRHFAIDTRFKFVTLVARMGGGRRHPINLRVANRQGELPERAVKIPLRALSRIRADLSVPEVRNAREWSLFARLVAAGTPLGDPDGPWQPTYRREADMTSDKAAFVKCPEEGTVPILEGRHVGQFRWRAKSYVEGEGRAAIWKPEPLGTPAERTQWHISTTALTERSLSFMSRSRIGFCDITGQTNERSFIAARIPAGFVCGNKVPTIAFPSGGPEREDLFLALANSLTVDWVLRRLITTTLNFFLLNSLPFPNVNPDSAMGRSLVKLAREATSAEGDERTDLIEVGRTRAQLDALVATVCGLTVEDLELVFEDFPLLDRGQPSIMGEMRSTVTRDCVLTEFARLHKMNHDSLRRLDEALEAGAIPYIPAEHAAVNGRSRQNGH